MSNGADLPATGLLEGLAGGFTTGYGFREQVKGRRRAQRLQADLMTLRQLEAERAGQRAGREQTTFDQQQLAYRRAEELRSGVAAHIAAPHLEGQPEPPLSAEATLAQRVGQTMGALGERELTPDQALLVGAGMVPGSAVTPKRYQPRSRAEWLDNLRIAAGIRAQTSRLPITLNAAFATLDRIYTVQDRTTGAWASRLTPAQKLTIAKKMVAGTVGPDDFPDIEEEMPEAESPVEAPRGPGVFDRLRNWWSGEPQGTPGMTPVPRPTVPGGEMQAEPGAEGDGAGAQDRIEQARQLISQYRDLPAEDLEAVLEEFGFDEETIRTILGTTAP